MGKRGEEDEHAYRLRLREVAKAWGDYVGRLPWQYAVTLTFDPKRVFPVRQARADREAWRWCADLGRLARRPVVWLYATERSAGGLWHAHVLLFDVRQRELDVATAVWEVRNGRVHVRAVFDGCGATLYASKSVPWGAEVVVSDTVSRLLGERRGDDVVVQLVPTTSGSTVVPTRRGRAE